MGVGARTSAGSAGAPRARLLLRVSSRLLMSSCLRDAASPRAAEPAPSRAQDLVRTRFIAEFLMVRSQRVYRRQAGREAVSRTDASWTLLDRACVSAVRSCDHASVSACALGADLERALRGIGGKLERHLMSSWAYGSSPEKSANEIPSMAYKSAPHSHYVRSLHSFNLVHRD